MKSNAIRCLFLAQTLSACAASPQANPRSHTPSAGAAIYERTVDETVEAAMASLEKGLKLEGFGVLFKANIGASLANNAERWGENYNRSELDEIRSVIFCNPKFANQASNEDPRALALCPLRITLIEKQGATRLLFVKPTVAGAETAAAATTRTVEESVIRAIDAV